MKRLRHQHRVEGINERIRSAADLPSADVIEGCFGEGGGIDDGPLAEALDRIRYGDCNGFGAPEARAADRRRRHRITAEDRDVLDRLA
jgi:hypothetical protein